MFLKGKRNIGDDIMKVCIDPGHSGPYEPGACADGVTEAAVNLAISKLVGEILYLFGHEVIYTRQGDIETDDLESRAQLANEKDADVFVSISLQFSRIY